MDTDKLRSVLKAIPAGRWMSYSDVVLAIGAPQAAAKRLNQQFLREDLPNAHRVLMANGRIAETALGDHRLVRERLVAEGVAFDTFGRAPSEARWRPEGAATPSPEVASPAS